MMRNTEVSQIRYPADCAILRSAIGPVDPSSPLYAIMQQPIGDRADFTSRVEQVKDKQSQPNRSLLKVRQRRGRF